MDAPATTPLTGPERDALERLLFDELTGLPARRLLTDRIAHALTRTRRTRTVVAVVLVKLAGLDRLRAERGGEVADGAVSALARGMERVVRPSDTVARAADDELAVLLEDLRHPADVRLPARRIADVVARPVVVGGEAVALGALVGVSAGDGLSVSPALLLREAADGMREPQLTRDGHSLVQPSRVRHVSDVRAELVAQLGDPAASNRVEVHYQHVVALPTRAPVAVEALMRWRDPMRGVLDAHELVPAAIEHGVIAGLGARVRNDALHAVSDWLHADRSRYLSVNLSGPELESDSLSTDLLTLVDSGGVSPAQLALEVREATYRDAAGGRARVLEDVRAAGFPVVIDGYGEGFSSYDQLERVPVDAIKLSGRLTEGIGRSPASERAITAILAFMRFFGLPVIGTDIETSAQLAFFAAHGCTLGQGYLLGPPVPADELDDARATIAAGELATDWLPPIHV